MECVEDFVSFGSCFLILQTHNWTVTPPALSSRGQETRGRPRERCRNLIIPISNLLSNSNDDAPSVSVVD